VIRAAVKLGLLINIEQLPLVDRLTSGSWFGRVDDISVFIITYA